MSPAPASPQCGQTPPAAGAPEVGVNVYLYRSNPNPAWRNADLRTRRPKRDLAQHAQAGLDLYYLLTFYGNEVELEPQRLMGSAVRTLVDQPILTSEMIQETINHPSFPFLQDSNLGEQVERVTIVPSFLSTDDLSKLWSVFFQAPYILSFACEGGTVLIEGDRPSGRALPVRNRQFYVTPTQPVIERVFTEAGGNQPIVADSRLVIRGKQLTAEITPAQMQEEAVRTDRLRRRQQQDLPGSAVRRRWQPQVQIGEARLTPQRVTETELRLSLAELPGAERSQLRAGVQSLQIVYRLVRRLSDLNGEGPNAEPEWIFGSNIVAFVLCPTILDVQANGVDRDDDLIVAAEVTVQVDLNIGPEQRVFLLLNQHRASNPAAYIFKPHRRTEASSLISFPIRYIRAGDYLVRLQVDGAESPLLFENEQFVNPRLEMSGVSL